MLAGCRSLRLGARARSIKAAAVDALTGELIGRTVPGGAGEVMALVTRPAGGVRGCQGDAVRPVRPVSGGPGALAEERGRPQGGGALQAAAP